MRRYRGKIIIFVLILSVLATTYFLEGKYHKINHSHNEELAIEQNITGEYSSEDLLEEEVASDQNHDINKDDKDDKDETATDIADTSGESSYSEERERQGDKAGQITNKDEDSGDSTLEEGAYTCILSVKCDTILDNIEHLDKDKLELLPEDGLIFPATEVIFYEGESVFNLLQREMKKNKIHMEFRNVPIYKSAYILAINNLYEFDVGGLSGWMYKVNDWFPNYGVSRYKLEDGDIVEFVYTCNLGRDTGGYNNLGGE